MSSKYEVGLVGGFLIGIGRGEGLVSWAGGGFGGDGGVGDGPRGFAGGGSGFGLPM